jgi:hypothetical protein
MAGPGMSPTGVAAAADRGGAAGPGLQRSATVRRPGDINTTEWRYKWYVITENRAELMLSFLLVRPARRASSAPAAIRDRARGI